MNASLNEAKAFSEIYQFARAMEPALNRFPIRTINESMQFLSSPLIKEEIELYDRHVFQSEPLVATLDMNMLRTGRDPFKNWLAENGMTLAMTQYEILREGLWDSLKSAASSVAGGLEKGAEFIGSGVKAVGSAVLRQFPWGQKVIDFLKMFTEGGSPIGIAQLLLDIIGAIPASYIGIPIDTVANLVNAIIYFGRGMYLNGVFSLLFVLPLGNWLKGVKYTFLKPFEWLGLITKGVAEGDKILVQRAGRQMAETAGANTFLGTIGKYINGLAGAVKSVIGNIMLFFKKFLPESWVAKIEQWMTSNLIKPVQSTETAVKIATEFTEKGGAKTLAKGGEDELADQLAKQTAQAKQGAELTTNVGTKAVTKKAGTILADEAADIATKVTGKISPAELSEMVLAENKSGIARLFGQAAQEQGLTAAEKELMEAFSRSPEVFIECQKLSKQLWQTIQRIERLAGPRRLLKLSRLALFFVRDYFKTNAPCFEMGQYAKFYNMAKQYPDVTSPVHESYLNEADGDTDSVDYRVPDSAVNDQPDQTQTGAAPDADTAQTMKQLGNLEFKNADPQTQADAKKQIAEKDKLGPCATIANQGSTNAGNAYINSMITQTPYGDYKVPSDKQETSRFEQIVNPELERIGIPPVHEYVYEKLYRMGTHERSKYIDVYDPVTKEVSVTTNQQQEDQRFEAFIQEEVKRTGLPEARVRAIVNQTKKENHELDQQLQSDSTGMQGQQQTNQ